MEPEKAWLQWVRRAAASGGRRELRLGIGDDAALLRPRRGHELAVTTDLLLEDVHFLRAYDEAAVCGRRLATRALSDLAAMGAEPLAAFVSSAYPAALPAAWPRQLYRGLLGALRAAGAVLAGGDVAAAPGNKILLDITAIGQVPHGRALRRAGARAGDLVYVSGPLGLAARGRELAHAGRTARTPADRLALRRHRQPRARWELGLKLRGVASAAMDLSDGLGTDLGHLCRESGVGAVIEAERIPRAEADADLALALFGGEDYELLFTVPAAKRGRVPAECTAIGRVSREREVWIERDRQRQRLPEQGWEHFSRRDGSNTSGTRSRARSTAAGRRTSRRSPAPAPPAK